MNWIFIDFSWKIYERKMKNPWKSRHPLFWVHRVYGIQNDRLDLTINKFLTVLKTQHRSYLQIGQMKKTWKIVNISWYDWYLLIRLFFKLFVFFEYHKPYELKKVGDDFSWIFHFSLKDFSWKIHENLFHKWETH